MDLKPEIIERIKLLDEKYQATGQDLLSYLDGLLYADYLTYWDYIHLDTLLSLQTPKTNIPDERIFIMYHQITELYFKLCMQEFGLLYDEEKPNGAFVLERLPDPNGRGSGFFDVVSAPSLAEPLQVAGAFTLDSKGAAFIRGVRGDHANVVGLSIAALRLLMHEVGVAWTDLWEPTEDG